MTSERILGFLLTAGLLLAACTAAGSSPMTETAAGMPLETATAVSPTRTPHVPVPELTQVEHDGISLSYDAALLGDVQIQDTAATTNQGLFDQPTPAHTWIGFDPSDMALERSNHWNVWLEPRLIVFNLNDFGSFAIADVLAREKIAAFQQLLAERPSRFSGEVPILPLTNAAQTLQAQVKWLDFDGGSGVRFLTIYSQAMMPAANDGLIYIFYGMTSDGLHGVTAIFPISAAVLPDAAPSLSDEEWAALNENYEAEMTAATEQLNAQPDSDFEPTLAELDALIQSLAITPTATDYPLTSTAPQNAQLLRDSDVYDAPVGGAIIGSLAARDAVVVNGQSADGHRRRILCADGSTGSCWLSNDALQMNEIDEGKPGIPVDPLDGQVARIQSLIENVVFNTPSESGVHLGTLRVGEVADVQAVNDSGDWLYITCPRNIAVNCWVIADPAVNGPIDFFSSDGWKAVRGEYVSFRVPIEWNVTAVVPGGGTVLEEWNLGIPGVESDQGVGFSAVFFDALKPDDVQSETAFEIGGQPGLKWVRGGEGYVSYDYHTAGTEDTQAAGAGSFGIHVTVAEADPNLEVLMDKLAASIIFSP